MSDKLYDVKIMATITKTIRVKAKDYEEAEEVAHGIFTVASDYHPEKYEQDTVSCEEVK